MVACFEICLLQSRHRTVASRSRIKPEGKHMYSSSESREQIKGKDYILDISWSQKHCELVTSRVRLYGLSEQDGIPPDTFKNDNFTSAYSFYRLRAFFTSIYASLHDGKVYKI